MAHTLLLADDSVTIQRVIELTFADEDIHVVAVSDGNQAIDVLGRTPPDIVLADIGMPGKNGYEVAEYMKETPRLSHIPVLLLTGAFEPVDQARADAVGCDGVLTKPFEPQLVIGRVKMLLAGSINEPASREADVTPSVQQPSVSAEPTVIRPLPTPPDDLDSYFQRLDEAFANLTDASPAAAPEPPTSSAAKEAEASWFANKPEREQAPSSRPALAVVDPPRGERLAVSAEVKETAVAEGPVDRPIVPSLADAFAALLSAERSGQPLAHTFAAIPVLASGHGVSDEVVEAITRRVVERLSDAVVRETVREIALNATERIVREEIERIKGAIK